MDCRLATTVAKVCYREISIKTVTSKVSPTKGRANLVATQWFSNCGVAKVEDYKINGRIGLNCMLIEGNRGAPTLQGIPLYYIQPSSHNTRSIKLFSEYFQFNFSFRRVQYLEAAFRNFLLWFGKQHLEDENVFGVGINCCIWRSSFSLVHPMNSWSSHRTV